MHKKILTLLIMMVALPGVAFAVEGPTLEYGRILFESKELGTKQRSCSDCHPDGKGLEQTGDVNDTELKDIINACIRDAMGGTLFAIDAQELEALLNYVKRLRR
jgi:hypothetical protein